jgi:hypothetical protein
MRAYSTADLVLSGWIRVLFLVRMGQRPTTSHRAVRHPRGVWLGQVGGAPEGHPHRGCLLLDLLGAASFASPVCGIKGYSGPRPRLPPSPPPAVGLGYSGPRQR